MARYHHGDLKNALIAEASRVLEEAGPEGFSLRSLARRLGVSHAAPGHHFADRRALLAELAADGFRDLADGMEAVLAEASADENRSRDQNVVYETGLVYVRNALDNPQRFKLMFGGGFLGSDECPERLEHESSRAFRALLMVARGERMSAEDFEAIDPETFQIEVPEFRTWALVHGAATLQIDGALGLRDDREGFERLMAAMLEDLVRATQ